VSLRQPAVPRITPPAPDHTPASDFAIDLVAILRFLRRHLWILVAPGLMLALGTAFFLLFLDSPSYEASTTVVVSPPALSSDFAPPAFTAYEYARLLASDSVVAEVRRRLEESGDWRPEELVKIDELVTTTVHSPSGRGSDNTIALLEITAESRSPAAAAQLANTWAGVLIETSTTLIWGTTASAIEVIEERYPESKDRLATLEEERLVLEKGYEDRLTAAAERWETRLATSRQKNEADIAAYQDETHELFRQVAERRGLRPSDNREADGEAGDLAEEDSLRGRLSSLLVVWRQLAQTLPHISLERSVGSDALSEAITQSEIGLKDLEAVIADGLSLTDQEPNPLYSELQLTASRLEMEIEGRSLERLSRLNGFVGELATLQRARSSGLLQLLADHDAEMANLRRERRAELATLQREREAALRKINREIAAEASLFSELAEHHKEAALQKAQKDLQPLHLVTPAMEPIAPEPAHVGLKAAVAGLVGLLLGLTVAVGRELGTS